MTPRKNRGVAEFEAASDVRVINWSRRLLDATKRGSAQAHLPATYFMGLRSSLIRRSAQGLCVLIEGVREHLFYGFNRDEV
jgi:hypothetical protein